MSNSIRWTPGDCSDLIYEQILVNIAPAAGGGKTHVDAGLAVLLGEVWLNGWPTFASCEDAGDGTAQISFDRTHDGIEFVVAVGFSSRVEVRLVGHSMRTGPMVDHPVALYFPRSWITIARHQLRLHYLRAAYVRGPSCPGGYQAYQGVEHGIRPLRSPRESDEY